MNGKIVNRNTQDLNMAWVAGREKNNNQKYEIPILKVVGPSMLIATDPKFQFGFAVQMWKVVEKPFI